MKINRLVVLVAILVVVSVSTNLLTMLKSADLIWPEESRVIVTEMFTHSVLWYRPKGTNSMAMIDMNDAVIVVSVFGAPMNCVKTEIHTPEFIIPGVCQTTVELESFE